MLSLSRALGRISISSVPRVSNIRPLSTTLVNEISTSNELERGRRDLTFFQEEGRYAPRKRAWKYGTGSSKAWNCYKPGVGKLAPGRLRTRQFGKDASLSMRVEDLPMMWQMRPMTKEERERFKDEPSIRLWQENMVERGFEEPQRSKRKDEGMMNLYRTHLQKRTARKRRMVIQYEHHIMRLRALTKNQILPDAIKSNAKDELYGLQHGRFKVLKGIDRSYPICRLHGRPVSVRPKFLVKRHPLRLLMDYGEGTCGTMRDFYKRRQREYWTDYLRRKKSRRLPRSWHRSESHYRYAYENTEK